MRHFNHYLSKACLLACTCIVAVACKDSDEFFNDKGGDNTPATSANMFDFSTTQEVDLIVDYSDFKLYGPVWFSVYSVNPYVNEMQADEYIDESIKPLFQGYTDEKGKFDATITLPAYARVLHVVTGNFFVSDRRILTEVINGEARAIAVNKSVSSRGVTTRAAGPGVSTDDLSDMKHLWCMNNGTQVYKPWSTALGTWNSASGRPDYLLDTTDPTLVSKGLVFSDEEVAGMYATACDALNSGTNLKETYRQAGDLTLIKESEVSITALGSSTCWNSSLGYYYYTGDAPTDKMDINVIMIFPNTQDGEWPRGSYPNNKYNGNIGAVRGDVVQLMYYPNIATGDMSGATTMFPAGTKIGFILKTNAWAQRGAEYAVNGSSYASKKNIWASSTDGLSYAPDGGSKPNPNGEARCAKFAYTAPNGSQYVVVSFEDATDDKDYDDLMFGLNPADAFDISGSGVAMIESRETITEGVYAFEDLWPKKGDYDMNDVVIDCKHKLEFYTHADGSNKLNKEIFYLTTDQNTVVLKSGLAVDFQASDISTLYVTKIPKGQTEPLTTDKMVDKKYYYLSDFTWEKSQSRMWYLTDDITRDLGTTYVFEVTYTKAVNKGQATVRPFLYRAEDGGKQWELHLPWTEPTSKMNTAYFNTIDDMSDPTVKRSNGQKMYYVSDSEYPFAFYMEGVSIDMFKNTILKPDNAGRAINAFFPKFINWSKSNGAQDTDWYLHPVEEQ